jgi:hypothetical protein
LLKFEESKSKEKLKAPPKENKRIVIQDEQKKK